MPEQFIKTQTSVEDANLNHFANLSTTLYQNGNKTFDALKHDGEAFPSYGISYKFIWMLHSIRLDKSIQYILYIL